MHAAPRRAERALSRVLVALAVVVALGVAVVGGVRSFEAVSVQFGSVLVPLTADGMIIACTALRLAALTRGWRLPGSLLITYGFIVGTVALNVTAAHGWADAVAHALAPVSYAVLVEMLAHLLRLHLRLTQPARPRLSFLTWATSPVVTTRVWLHLARTGGDDPVAARALIQQIIRMSSRLRAVCPGRWPLGRAAAARTAALQTVRDGLLSAETLAGLLPDDGRPAAARRAARPRRPGRTATHCTSRTGAHRRRCTGPHRARRTAAAPARRRCGAPGAHRRRTRRRTAPARRPALRPPGDAPPRRRHPESRPARPARRLGTPGTADRRGAPDPQHPGPLHVVTDLSDPDPPNDENDQPRTWSSFGTKRGRNGQEARARRSTTTWSTELHRRSAQHDVAHRHHRAPHRRRQAVSVRGEDACSGRIVGYSIADRMKARLAVDAAASAVARRRVEGATVAGCLVYSDRGSQFRSRKFLAELRRHNLVGSMGRVGAASDNAAMESFFALLQNNVLDRRRSATRRTADRDHQLDRAHLPPPPPPATTRTVDPHRIRDDHEHTRGASRLTTAVTYSGSRPFLLVGCGYLRGCHLCPLAGGR